MYQWYFYLPKLKIMRHSVTYEYTYEENRRGLFEIIISFFKMKYIVSWVFVCSMEDGPSGQDVSKADPTLSLESSPQTRRGVKG